MHSRYLIDQYFALQYDGRIWKQKIQSYDQGKYGRLRDKIIDIISGNPGVLGIQGVPGAGKTTFYAYILAEYLKDVICKEESKKPLFIYIAPTNDLLVDFIEKFMGFLKGAFGVSCSERVLATRIRAYGSKISSTNPLLLKKIDEKVLLVVSTDWQRVSARIEASREQYYLIDEASRMTFIRFFVPIADALARRRAEGDIKGIVVIGDENQAVGLEEEERDILLLKKIREFYEKGDERSFFDKLEISWRIPRGTERPIKDGFYGGFLEAMGEPFTITIEPKIIESIEKHKICRKYKRLINEFSNLIGKNSFVHIELEKLFEKGKKYDRLRAEIMWCLGKLLNNAIRAMSYDIGKRTVTIITPYTQLGFDIRSLGDISGVKFGTVASYLGREDDIIITALAKEYGEAYTGGKTYYLLDPYSANVQLSRQRGAIYTIGSAEKLKNTVEFNLKNYGKLMPAGLSEGYEKLLKTLEVLLSEEKGIGIIRI